jgi:hypothetical protein
MTKYGVRTLHPHHFLLLLCCAFITKGDNTNTAGFCELSSPEPLKDYLFFSQGANPTDGTITILLIYEGQAWLGIGRSDNGRMIGGEAVIGRPEEADSANNPGKYIMTGESTNGVNLMEAQTLMNATIEQNDTHTILTYSKYLDEAGELTISQTAPDTWIWAVGSENAFPSMHQEQGHFSFLASPCGSGSIDGIDSSSSESTYSLWKVHGIFMGLAWGIFVPLAIGASLARRIFPGDWWYQLHRALNVSAVLFTLIGLSLAIAAFQEEGEQHFVASTHTKAGISLVVLVIVQATMGFLKPHAPAKPFLPEMASHDCDNGNRKDNPGNKTSVQGAENREAPKKTLKRLLWEYKHRIFGAALVGLAWFTSYTGTEEFDERYSTDTLPLFLIVYCSVTEIVLGLVIFARFF